MFTNEEKEAIIASFTRDQLVLFGELHLEHGALANRVNELETAQEERVRRLELAIDGRLEYATGSSETRSTMTYEQILRAEADTLTSALKIVLGDPSPLYAMLPSWRWGEAGLS